MSNLPSIASLNTLNSDRVLSDQGKQTTKRRLSLDDRVFYRSNKIFSVTSPIQPIQSETTPDNDTDRKNSTVQPEVFQQHKFYDVYGRLGVVMLVAFSLASLTMTYEAVVQIVPNWTANFLMGTGELDNGEFLVISRPSDVIVATSAVMFAVFACLYLYLIVLMLSYNKESTVRSLTETRSTNSLLTRLVLRSHSLFETKRVHNQTIKETKTVIAVAAALARSKSLKAYAVKVQQAPVLRAYRANKLIHNILNTDGKYYRYFVSNKVEVHDLNY
ncbi:hypothetical protein DVH05_018537 [Phytophthora capsici]|nr:hypothetical protein DVH05_018537 [Phytophthora capsici]